MKKIIVAFCVVFSFISFFFLFNSEPVKFNTVTAKDKFSISVPEYLTKTDSIDPTALLQYKNEEEQLFLLVYEKRDTLMQPIETYFKKFSNNLISKMSRGNLLKYYPKQLNNHHAMIGNIRGNVNGTGVYYRVAVIKSDNLYYEIVVGIADDNRSNYDNDINMIIQSFTLLPS